MTQPVQVWIGSTTKYPTAGNDMGPDVTVSNGTGDVSAPFSCVMNCDGLQTLANPSIGSLPYNAGVRSYNPPTGWGKDIPTAVNAAKAALYAVSGINPTLLQFTIAERRIAQAVATATLDYNTVASGQATPLPAAVGYGHDLSCISDLDPAMVEVDGPTTLAQALVRRISTPRGALIDDPNYGIDLPGFLNDDMTPAQISQIGAQMDAEFLKDERVRTSQTTTSFFAGVLTTSSVIVGAQGPFRLVLSITDVNVAILKVSTSP